MGIQTENGPLAIFDNNKTYDLPIEFDGQK